MNFSLNLSFNISALKVCFIEKKQSLKLCILTLSEAFMLCTYTVVVSWEYKYFFFHFYQYSNTKN